MDPVIVVGGARVFHGDCIEVLKQLPENSVDSIVTDPPYGLEFMGKDWDSFREKRDNEKPGKKTGQTKFWSSDESSGIGVGGPRFGTQGIRERRAFEQFSYDWAVECFRVLKPGGHLLAFGGTRMWHRLAVGIEDAGFEIRDNIAWIYGSGFPKSLDVSKAIDKRAGVEREKVPATGGLHKNSNMNDDNWSKIGDENPLMDSSEAITSEAKAWEGWGTALKPAHEPVVVGRKPLVGTVAENVLAWGVGGLNIDGSRIGTEQRFNAHAGNKATGFTVDDKRTDAGKGLFAGKSDGGATAQGRWPANVIFDEVTAGMLDEQSGERPGGQFPARRGNSVNTSFASGQETAGGARGMGDTGGASRFFYVAKASKRDRNEGLEELQATDSSNIAAVVRGDGTRGTVRQNFHPTVKPTQLMRYLIKLVTPPGGTVLDPFTGSGSTGKAALLDGFDFVGVELTGEYLPIIEGRLRWASEQVGQDDTLF